MRVEDYGDTLVVLEEVALLFLDLLRLSEGASRHRGELLSMLMLIREDGFVSLCRVPSHGRPLHYGCHVG